MRQTLEEFTQIVGLSQSESGGKFHKHVQAVDVDITVEQGNPVSDTNYSYRVK